MSERNLSLRPFRDRTPRPPIRTPRGNFRYSTWIAQAYERVSLFGPTPPPQELAPATLEAGGDELIGVRLFLFGSDNIARAQARTWVLAYEDSPIHSRSMLRQITTLSEYSLPSTVILPASTALAGESVYATINGVGNVRGILCEFTTFYLTGTYAGPYAFEVDATFDCGVVAGLHHFSDGTTFSRPVILPADQFTTEVVDNAYAIEDDFDNVGTVVGVYEQFVPSYYY